MTNITFFDRCCGFGKSEATIAHAKKHVGKPFLVVVPTLDEVARYRAGLPHFHEPETGTENKSDDLRELLTDGQSIVCTHKLFDLMTPDHLALLVNYKVVIDEVLAVVEAVTLKGLSEEGWNRTYVENGYATVTDDGMVVPTDKWAAAWDDLALVGSKKLYPLARKERLWKGANGGFFVNELPHQVFTVPAMVEVLTYMAEFSLMSKYLDRRKLAYEIDKDHEADTQFRKNLGLLLTVIPNKTLERFGWGHTKQQARTDKETEAISSALGSIRKNVFKGVPNKDILWSCVKSEEPRIANRLSRMRDASWSPKNCKGTNSYRHCTHGIYLNDLYLHPSISQFYGTDDAFCDGWALSELIQWLYRTALRDNRPVTVIMPAKRMRGLLQRYLNG
jgi:hypothetical protein